jgi:hypothetical protein
MKKYRIILALLMAFLISGLVYQTRADMGPKPTADIEIIGVDEPYYFDILFEVSENEARILSATKIQEELEHDYYLDDYPDILNGYRDSDGFASYTLYKGIPHEVSRVEGTDHTYHLGYFAPPDTFKIVIVTESGNMFVSEIVNKTMFSAYFTFDLSSVEIVNGQDIYLNQGTVIEEIPVELGKLALSVLGLIALTLFIELLIMLAFGYRDKKAFIKVGIVNVITQLILQVMVLYGYVYVWSSFGALAYLVIGEFVVFIIEIVAFRIILKEKTKGRATLYAFVANLASFILGLVSLGYIIRLFN